MMGLFNPKPDIRIVRHGLEQQPVIVADNLLSDPEEWRKTAAGAEFRKIGPHYPGVRAPVEDAAANAIRSELEPFISDVFELDPVPPLLECYFSIVTTKGEALAPIQRLPHVDGLEPDRIAILIYLSGAEMGGTAFYRQRSTGFETLDEQRYPLFEAELRAGVAQYGLPPPGYIAGDTPLYERIACYDARPNRAIIYRSRALHCAAIRPGTALSDNPGQGRLTINAFLFDPAQRP